MIIYEVEIELNVTAISQRAQVLVDNWTVIRKQSNYLSLLTLRFHLNSLAKYFLQT